MSKMIGKNNPSYRHGLSKTRLYWAWSKMIDRCKNKKLKQYDDYGGRGITVCERWLSFENFYADMGDRPSGMMLERVDNDGNYEPSNCRWATREEQNRNRRNNSYIEYQGKRIQVTECARILGISKSAFLMRVKRGWQTPDLFRKMTRIRRMKFKRNTAKKET